MLLLCAGAAATVAVGVATLQSGGRGLDPACQPEPGTFFAEQSALCPCAVGRAHITTWHGSGSIPKHATTHSHTQLAHSPLHVGGHQCLSSCRRCVASQHHERSKGASGTSAFLPTFQPSPADRPEVSSVTPRWHCCCHQHSSNALSGFVLTSTKIHVFKGAPPEHVAPTTTSARAWTLPFPGAPLCKRPIRALELVLACFLKGLVRTLSACPLRLFSSLSTGQ